MTTFSLFFGVVLETMFNFKDTQRRKRDPYTSFSFHLVAGFFSFMNDDTVDNLQSMKNQRVVSFGAKSENLLHSCDLEPTA